MPVVVDHHHAADLPVPFEAPLGAAEGVEGCSRPREANPHSIAHRDGRQRVLQVVPPRHGQLEHAQPFGAARFAAMDNAAAAECAELDLAADHVGLVVVEPVGHDAPLQQRQHRRKIQVVGAGDDGPVERHLVAEVGERLLQFGEAAVALHVLVVDVGDHGDRRPQHQERAIALVGFRHHVLALTESCVAAERAQASADDCGRIESRPLEGLRNHRRRGRLSM
jgi:hypothetical protein